MTRKVCTVLGLLVLILGGVYWLAPTSAPDVDRTRSQELRRRMSSGEAVTIVALGDSITAGVGAPEPFTRIVERRLRDAYHNPHITVVNAGVSGDTAERGLARLDRDVLSKEPDAVCIEFGWNDLRTGVSEEAFDRALRELTTRFRTHAGTEVYLMTTTHVNITLAHWKVRSRNQLIRSLADDLDTGLIDLFRGFSYARSRGADIVRLMSADRIHPSGEGQQLIAETVLAHFLPDLTTDS